MVEIRAMQIAKYMKTPHGKLGIGVLAFGAAGLAIALMAGGTTGLWILMVTVMLAMVGGIYSIGLFVNDHPEAALVLLLAVPVSAGIIFAVAMVLLGAEVPG